MTIANILRMTVAAAALWLSTTASALEKEPFTKERFDQLQAQGAVVLVDIGASWCPDCKKQQEVLSQYDSERPEAPLHVLAVDFDTQKEWVTHFRAPRQSTLILFEGTEQLWFSVAETRKEQIFNALDAAL